MLDALSFHLVALQTVSTDAVDDVEADAEEQEGGENDAHSCNSHTKTVFVHFMEHVNFLVGVADDVVARRGDVRIFLSGANGPGVGALTLTIYDTCETHVGLEHRHGDGVDECDAVGVIDTDPVGMVGSQDEAGVESASRGFAVGPEDHMLALADAGLLVAQGHRIHLGPGGVGGNEDARDFQGSVVAVEKLYPGLFVAVVVLEVGLVDHHHLVDAQPLSRLGERGDAAESDNGREKQRFFLHDDIHSCLLESD